MNLRVLYRVLRQERFTTQSLVIGGLAVEFIGVFTSLEVMLAGAVYAATGLLLTIQNLNSGFNRARMLRIERELGLEWEPDDVVKALSDANLEEYSRMAEEFYRRD